MSVLEDTLKLMPGQQKSICLPFEIEKSGKLAVFAVK
jgi:hypothetical protein